MKVSELFGLKGKHFKSIFEKLISFWFKAYMLCQLMADFPLGCLVKSNLPYFLFCFLGKNRIRISGFMYRTLTRILSFERYSLTCAVFFSVRIGGS